MAHALATLPATFSNGSLRNRNSFLLTFPRPVRSSGPEASSSSQDRPSGQERASSPPPFVPGKMDYMDEHEPGDHLSRRERENLERMERNWERQARRGRRAEAERRYYDAPEPEHRNFGEPEFKLSERSTNTEIYDIFRDMIPSFIPWQHLTLTQKGQLRDENINNEQSWYNSKGSGYARIALYTIVRGIKAQLALDTAQAADLQACA